MSRIYYLSQTNSDLSGGADFSKLLSTITETQDSISVPLANNATEISYGFTGVNNPGTAGTSTGTFTVKVRFTTSNASVSLAISLERINSSGVVQSSSSTTTSQVSNGAQPLTFTLTNPSLGTWNDGDRLRVSYRFINATGGARTVIIESGTVDTEVTTPFVAPSATPTPSQTPTPTITPSITPSNSTTPTQTPSNTPTPSITPSTTLTPTATPTPSVTKTPSITPTITPSISITPSITPEFNIQIYVVNKELIFISRNVKFSFIGAVTSNIPSEIPGKIWVKNNDLMYSDGSGIVRLITGITENFISGYSPGSIYLKGKQLRWVSSLPPYYEYILTQQFNTPI